MTRRERIPAFFLILILVTAAAVSVAADSMEADPADTSAEYLAARDRFEVVEGTEAVLSGGNSQLAGKVLEVAGKIAGRSSTTTQEGAGLSFMLRVGEETLFVDAAGDKAPIGVGDIVQALIEFPENGNPLDHFRLHGIAYLADLPPEIRLQAPESKDTPQTPEESAAADSEGEKASSENDEGTSKTEEVTPAETPEETTSEKTLAEKPPRPGTQYPDFEQLWPEQNDVRAWMGWIGEQNSELSEMTRRVIAESVLYWADQFEVDHRLVFAMIKAESNFDPNCRSHAGAVGLTQLMPGTAKYLGVSDPWNIQQNIMGGVRYLAEQLNLYSDRSPYEQCVLGLACYNAGPNAVKRAGGIPNNGQTPQYCQKVAELFYRLWKNNMP